MKERQYTRYFGDPFVKNLECMKGHYPVLENEIKKRHLHLIGEIEDSLHRSNGYFRNKLRRGNIEVQEAITIQKNFFPEIPIEILFGKDEML